MLTTPKQIPKVKLVAIAKDEGAYVADWIHHHLYFGFDAIEVWVNRSNDNTAEIVEKIGFHFPSVSLKNADFVDLNADVVKGEIQRIIYSLAYQESREEFSHIMFLDIDEFWTPLDFQETISSYLMKNPEDVISFEWLNKVGEDEPFGRPFKDKTFYQLGRSVKSVFKTSLKMTLVGIHTHQFEGDYTHVLADGTVFEHESTSYQRLKSGLSSVKEHFILHRMFKSQIEYIALLHRGNPVGNKQFKYNRPGYPTKNEAQAFVLFDDSLIEKYDRSFSHLVKSCGLDSLLDSNKALVEKRAHLAIESIKQTSFHEQADLKKVLKGINIKVVQEALDLLSERNVGKVINIFETVDLSSEELLAIDVKANTLLAEIIDFKTRMKQSLDCDVGVRVDKILQLENIETLKDSSIRFQEKNSKFSYLLISLAFLMRPSPAIKKLRNEARQKMEAV